MTLRTEVEVLKVVQVEMGFVVYDRGGRGGVVKVVTAEKTWFTVGDVLFVVLEIGQGDGL